MVSSTLQNNVVGSFWSLCWGLKLLQLLMRLKLQAALLAMGLEFPSPPPRYAGGLVETGVTLL